MLETPFNQTGQKPEQTERDKTRPDLAKIRDQTAGLERIGGPKRTGQIRWSRAASREALGFYDSVALLFLF